MRKIFGFLRFVSFRRCKSYLRRCGAFARTERNFPAFGHDTPLEREEDIAQMKSSSSHSMYSLLFSSVMFQLISCIRGSNCLQRDHRVYKFVELIAKCTGEDVKQRPLRSFLGSSGSHLREAHLRTGSVREQNQ